MRRAWIVNSVIVLVLGVFALEGYFRSAHGYDVWSFSLTSAHSFWRDRDILLWNSHFKSEVWERDQNRIAYFDSPPLKHTKYLFKPHLKMLCQFGRCRRSTNKNLTNFATNELGVIADTPLGAVKNKKRVFILGASVTESRGLRLLSQLRKDLKTFANIDVDVFNLSISASDTASHEELLREIILPQKPDYILYYWGDREMLETQLLANPICSISDHQPHRPLCWLYDKPKWMQALYFHSVVFRLLQRKYRFGYSGLANVDLDWKKSEALWQDIAKRIYQMHTEAKKAQATFLVFKNQNLFQIPDLPVSDPLVRDVLYDIYPLDGPLIDSYYTRSNAFLKESAKRDGYEYCDDTLPFEVHDFSDYVHLEDSGTDKLARGMAQCLARTLQNSR